MQMTAEQLINEFRDTVLDLHMARRQIETLTQEVQALRSELTEIKGSAIQQGDSGGTEPQAEPQAA